MRNDANDDFDDVPSLRADPLDDDVFPTTSAARERTSVHSRGTPAVSYTHLTLPTKRIV